MSQAEVGAQGPQTIEEFKEKFPDAPEWLTAGSGSDKPGKSEKEMPDWLKKDPVGSKIDRSKMTGEYPAFAKDVANFAQGDPTTREKVQKREEIRVGREIAQNIEQALSLHKSWKEAGLSEEQIVGQIMQTGDVDQKVAAEIMQKFIYLSGLEPKNLQNLVQTAKTLGKDIDHFLDVVSQKPEGAYATASTIKGLGSKLRKKM